jgi:hypothetical protein
VEVEVERPYAPFRNMNFATPSSLAALKSIRSNFPISASIRREDRSARGVTAHSGGLFGIAPHE